VENRDLMRFWVSACCASLFAAALAPAWGHDMDVLQQVQTVSLPGVSGRLDHVAVDVEKERLFAVSEPLE
jgi:hypothetical protein